MSNNLSVPLNQCIIVSDTPLNGATSQNRTEFSSSSGNCYDHIYQSCMAVGVGFEPTRSLFNRQVPYQLGHPTMNLNLFLTFNV